MFSMSTHYARVALNQMDEDMRILGQNIGQVKRHIEREVEYSKGEYYQEYHAKEAEKAKGWLAKYEAEFKTLQKQREKLEAEIVKS